ncbi:acyl-CoA dehydrogenase family protein [Patulibacter defluvii]|uniref:acyl-CoA dehydrogenase family protein n=1 Tax=Patulibacter defluvii TaxID=3095358 RepID=UPI002A74C08B|nr:acyl-CoA dehydrogenase family protein [Patulibacter sp. DM4]
MNLELTDEQIALRDAARGTLSRFDSVAAAREALETPGALPDIWPAAVDAGWPGLVVAERHGGIELGVFEAMLVAEELGRTLASVPFIGLVPAAALLSAADHDAAGPTAEGETRPVYLPACPPSPRSDDGVWTVDGIDGERTPAPVLDRSGSDVTVTGTVAWVPDAPGADLLVVVATDDGRPTALVVDASADGVTVTSETRYDATRSMANITLDGAAAVVLACSEEEIAGAWHTAQALLAAEGVGTVDRALELAGAYAKERYTFGRAIGSYQAIKHELVEILRRLQNARALLLNVGWAAGASPDDLPMAASAARYSAGHALDFAARSLINVHGGIGATWEHDAPLYFRRAQLSRRLVGGLGVAGDRLADECLARARRTVARPETAAVR